MFNVQFVIIHTSQYAPPAFGAFKFKVGVGSIDKLTPSMNNRRAQWKMHVGAFIGVKNISKITSSLTLVFGKRVTHHFGRGEEEL